MHSYDRRGGFKKYSIYSLWGRLWCEAGHLLLSGNCGSRVKGQTKVKDLEKEDK